ncbi:MAG: apolipoprotein N-acyltransferase [Candidatus Omnitrophica bacterium]|nr:apolipoprotein N-acyltransferase [Candidatus Omnitrophota bacterium]
MLNLFLSVCSAILLFSSFPKADLGFLAWFALVPWLFAIQKQKPARAFLISYLVGLIFFLNVVSWVTYVSNLGFTILVLYLALYFAVFGLFFSINYRPSTINNLLVIPAGWVGLEYIRSHLFTGFSWSLLGYSQYKFLPVIQLSDITGAYGVSFLVVLVNVGLWQLIKALKFREQKSLPSVLCLLFSVILVLSYGYFKLDQSAAGPSIKVATIQGNIPQQQKWDPQFRDDILKSYLQLTEEAARSHPDIIIWPETSVPGFLVNDPQLLEQFTRLSKQVYPAYLLLGTPYEAESGKIYNSAMLFFQGRIIQRYDKVHLVPFGEFTPGAQFFSRFSFASLIGNFSPGEDYTIFHLADRELKFSTLICFEDSFGDLARIFVRQGAQILVNLTNDAWFGASAEPYQHLQASVFRAVENRVNLVRSANTGVSCFINPWGKISHRVSDDLGRDILVKGYAVKDVKIIPIPSFYTSYGDIFAWACLTVSAFAFVGKKTSSAQRAVFLPIIL